MTNIIQDHILLNGESMSQADADTDLEDVTLADVLDERFDMFMRNMAEDGHCTIRDIFYNGMYTLINIMNAVAEDYETGDPYADTLALVEEVLTEKAAENEIDLSYSEDPSDNIDIDDLYEDEEVAIVPNDNWDEEDEDGEDPDEDQFTDDDK